MKLCYTFINQLTSCTKLELNFKVKNKVYFTKKLDLRKNLDFLFEDLLCEKSRKEVRSRQNSETVSSDSGLESPNSSSEEEAEPETENIRIVGNQQFPPTSQRFSLTRPTRSLVQTTAAFSPSDSFETVYNKYKINNFYRLIAPENFALTIKFNQILEILKVCQTSDIELEIVFSDMKKSLKYENNACFAFVDFIYFCQKV